MFRSRDGLLDDADDADANADDDDDVLFLQLITIDEDRWASPRLRSPRPSAVRGQGISVQAE
jgi:hypothetical protein